MLDSFAIIATSTARDLSDVAELTVTKITLAVYCTATHALLVTALQDMTKLQASVAYLKRQLSTKSSVRSHSNHYCWICGQ